MGYMKTVAQELDDCDRKLKEVRNVIDSLIADYESVPSMKRLFQRKVLIAIGENVVSAQISLSMIADDAKKVGK